MDSLANRYASALLDLARKDDQVKDYKLAIHKLMDELFRHDEISKYLESYFVSEDNKYTLVEELCSPYKLKHLAPFMKLLVEKHRIYGFRDIAKEFIKLCNDELGIAEGFVYSTSMLSEDQMAALEDSLSQRLHRRVELKNEIDESLIGGIKVVVRDRIFDGSLKNKLENLKNGLLEGRNVS